jgi:hypothetical protein
MFSDPCWKLDDNLGSMKGDHDREVIVRIKPMAVIDHTIFLIFFDTMLLDKVMLIRNN